MIPAVNNMGIQEQAIAAIEKCAGPAKQRGPGRWTASLHNGRPIQVSAACDDDWLLLAAQPQGRENAWRKDTADLPGLLAWNSRLPGGGRWAVAPGERAAHLRADIRLSSAVDLASRVRDTCDAFLAAARMAEGEDVPQENSADGVIAQADHPAGTADLGRLCIAAGWEHRERSSGTVAVSLEAATGFYQATVEERASGLVSASVAMATREGLPVRCRQARALLLLQATAVVRMVRAAEAGNGRTVERLEVTFMGIPAPAELQDALAALSVACRLCGEEARALEDESLAGEFLQIHGW